MEVRNIKKQNKPSSSNFTLFPSIKNYSSLVSIFIFISLLIPELSFASDSIPILDKALNGLSSYLTGKFATGLGVLTVAGTGYGTLVMGKLSKSQAVSVIIGLGLVFGAGQVLSMLGYGNN